ncbi:hypothetical protein DL240_12710 [Lujinxingia litoralis]|uniref:Uncharacterized protein n=1 Tax=Lujinxingia litoralis TaxID=2211119 RepID=A0A328C4P1_9DELT|nr:hypothetical protein [Lujinxingia litoralis]RAL21709.1 hypothetical protein DL240_12710 [Lujinxingia litoralis]
MTLPPTIFEERDLDPRQSPAELTRTLQQLARTLPPEERQRLRDDWRTLTTDPAERLAQAIWTPPRATSLRDPFARLSERPEPAPPALPALRPTLEDALNMDARQHNLTRLTPPFWPGLDAAHGEEA